MYSYISVENLQLIHTTLK